MNNLKKFENFNDESIEDKVQYIIDMVSEPKNQESMINEIVKLIDSYHTEEF